MTVTTQQVQLLMKYSKKHTQEVAASKAGMSVKTVRKYSKGGSPQLVTSKQHIWKTRKDGFEADWPALLGMLE